MTIFGQAGNEYLPTPIISVVSQQVKIFQCLFAAKNTKTYGVYGLRPFWHGPCTVPRIVGVVRWPEKEFNMTQYARTQILSTFAAIICAFITIGMSVAPAVVPDAAIIA
jgi:hypothetical protein